MNRAITLTLVFLVTFGVVIGGTAVAGFVTADGAEAPPEIDTDHYLDEDRIHDDDPGEADVTMSSDAPSQTIVVDPGVEAPEPVPFSPLGLLGLGGPDVTDRDIRPLVNALIENGHEVRVHVPENDQQSPAARPGAEDDPTELGAELAEADAFVTFRTDYSDEEIEDIETFVDADGHVLFATDPDEEFDEPGAAALDAGLDVTTRPGYVYNMAENDLNYQRVYAEPTGAGELTEGVDRAMFASATPVGTVASGTDVVRPIEGSELSTTRASTDAPLLVRNDGVVAIGDSDFMSPENAQRADNDALIGNLADFLVTNDRDPASQPPDTKEEEEEEEPMGPRPTDPDPPTEPPEEEPEPAASLG